MHGLSKKGLFNLIFAFWYFLIINNKVRKFKPDVALVADETSNCFWGFWAKKVNFPYVSYCSVPHLTAMVKQQYNGILRKIKGIIIGFLQDRIKFSLYTSYLNSAFILAVSSSTKKQLSKITKLSKKIRIVPRSVDDMFFQRPHNQEEINDIKIKYNINNKQFVILSVANIDPVKGIEDVIHALYNLKNFYYEKIKYLVVGDGPALPHLKKLVKKYFLNDIVYFTGNVLHSKIISYYDVSDFFVLPSRKGNLESFGRVFVEAAARSVGSIGVKDGGMVDIIEDGKTGFLIKVGDIKAIEEKISFLIENYDLSKIIGKNAREKAERLYNRKIVSLKIQKYLNDAIELYHKKNSVIFKH
jgi:glycosyltransferase involved in cell wall biosynthesis